MPTEGQVQGANQGGIPVPKPMPAAPSSSSPIPAPANGHVVIRPLRTYKDDLAEAIKKGNLSKTSIALAEKNKHAQKQAPVAPTMPPKPVAPAPQHVAPKTPPAPAPKIVTPAAPPAPAMPKPVVPTAPKPAPAPVAPRVPEIPATPKISSPTPAPEDAESKRRFFENLLHVRREERAAPHQELKTPVAEEKPEPIAPPKSLAELLPKKESFSVTPAQSAPASIPTPKQKPAPVVAPQPKISEQKPEAPSAKDVSPFLPFWATPDGQAPTAERTPEPEAEPKKPEVYVPLTPRADGPTRGSAVEDESSGVPLRLVASALGGIVLIVALGFGGYALFKKGGTAQPPVAREFPSHLVTVTSTATIDTTGHAGYELANAFYEEIAKVSSGKAVGIVFAKTENGQSVPLTATEWFAQARITPPGMFVRALAPSFAAGSYESHNGGNAFFVFEATSRDRALGGLLSWEKTLAGDMRPYLHTEPLPGTTFSDRTISGISVRIAGAGESALVYGMIDDRRIIITRGEGTFAGLVDSLPQGSASVQ